LYFNPTLGLPFAARVLTPNTRLVVTIHDMIPFFFPNKYSRKRLFLVKTFSVLAAKIAHIVLTVSENSRKDIISITGVNENKVKIVYNFIPRRFESENTQHSNFFLCVSTLEPGKNVENTIRGFAEFLRKSETPFKFYWIGRLGWVFTETYLNNLIKDQNVEGSFVLLGYLSEPDKQEYLRKCTAIVYLSYYEGFGLPILEGMTYNKVALAANNSSLPEVVGKAGILCDPSDVSSIAAGMKSLIENQDKLMGEIPNQIKRFEPEEQIRKFLLYINHELSKTK
jgi:glycosyltransferase involved in cell wall biosynthesis